MYPAYPQLDTADFYGRVYHDARYYAGASTTRAAAHSREGGTFTLMEQQHQLPLFLSPVTGARTQYLYHGTGTGKSGTIALCALRYACVNDKPVLFLVPNEHVKLEIEYEIMGREVTHVDGKSKSVFVRKFLGDAFITEQMRASLNSLETERAKDALCRKIWDEHVSRYFEVTTHTKFENAVLGDPIPRPGSIPPAPMSQPALVECYDGRGIVVDEAHYMRKEKRLFQALMIVVRSCRISTLFLLTATPLIESADEICPLVNLMLAAERVPYCLTPDVVRAYVMFGDQRAEQILRWCFRGRISYVRGLDPRTFPKRVDCGEKIFADLPEHRVWSCYMEGRQAEAYFNAFMEEFAPNAEAGQRNDLWGTAREIARCYTLKDMGRWTPTQKGRRWLANDQSEHWKSRRMVDLSAKHVQMHHIVTANQQQPTGPVLVFSSNIEAGVRRHQAFFTANTFRPWSMGQNLYPFRSHVDISGQVAFGRARDAIKILKSDKNYLGELLKVVIASPRITTGITLRHFSVAILDEVHWTIGDREQIIGRMIRHGSHEHSSDPYCNKTVRVYVMCARIRPQSLETLNPVMLKRLRAWIAKHEHALRSRGFLDEHGNLYTVDERTLRVALERDREIAKVTRLMKEMMLPLNLAQNYFPDEGDEFRNTRLYEYMPDPARVPIPSDRYPSPCSEVPPVPTHTDNTFLNLDGWFRYVCSGSDECYNLDFCGNIRQAVLEALEQKKHWLISELLQHVAKCAHVTELEAALVISSLAKASRICIELSTGWVYLGVAGHFDPVYEWQQQEHDSSSFLPPPPVTNLHTVLREANYVNIDDVLGKFQKRTPRIPIGQKIAAYCVLLSPSPDSTLYDITKTAPFCGVYDNTSDNPDEYQLKILTVKPDGKGTNKVSAHSKHDVDGLIGLVTEIDGDTGAVLESSHKKKAACDEISIRLEETGRLMPWDPEVDPTLLRALCIARAWELRDVIDTLAAISAQVIEALERLCVTLLLGKHKIVLGADSLPTTQEDKFRTIVHEQLAERVASKGDYVLRVLDRLENKRPRNLSVDQYATALKWYEENVINRFGEQLRQIRVQLRRAMEARCARIVEERHVRGRGLKKKK